MTDKELLEKTSKRLRLIADDTQRITSGNISHNLTCLRGFALRAAESIERHLQEPVNEDLEEASYRFACKCHPLKTECSTSIPNREVIDAFKAGAEWQKEQMMAKAVDVTIAIPYQNGDGGYSQLVDSKEALPFGDKLKVLVIKED